MVILMGITENTTNTRDITRVTKATRSSRDSKNSSNCTELYISVNYKNIMPQKLVWNSIIKLRK